MCLTPKWASSTFRFAPVYPCRAFTRELDFSLVAIHVLIGTLWSLTLMTATRYAAGILKKPAVVKWMDRTTGCLFLLFAAKLAMSRR